MTIDLATARAVVKADGDDDAIISVYLAAARGICEGYCNRRFYDTQEESDNDYLAALSALQNAEFARYGALTDAVVTGGTTAAITDRYIQIIANIKGRINGIVIDGLIEAAILMTMAHLYFNREDDAKVPLKAQRILQPKLWIGDLVDGVMVDYGGEAGDEPPFASLDFRYPTNSQYIPLVM